MRIVSRASRASLAPLALLVLVATPALAQSAKPADSTAARVDKIFAQWDHVNSPGCAVAVSRNGELAYERGYGMSNMEHAIAITPGAIFHVASISKQFT